MFLTYQKKMAAIIATSVFFVALDRFFKVLAAQYLSDKATPLIGHSLTFRFVKNYQIAFSLPLSGVILNIFIILTIFFLLAIMLRQIKKRDLTAVPALTFLIVGAISNLLDRWLYGYVVDYLDLRYFTVFNIADMMIVGGAAGIFLCYKHKPI